MKINDIDIYLGKRDKFFYAIKNDLQISRNNKLSELLDLDEKIIYYMHGGDRETTNIACAKFWKDNQSINKFINNNKDYKGFEITKEEFINLIPNDIILNNLSENISLQKNIKFKKEQLRYDEVWKEFRKKYKGISSYVKVLYPSEWLHCKVCGLIPLVWEYNNGRSTACGCGKNDYDHLSIQCESVMSYVKRNNGSAVGFNPNGLRDNWNEWVSSGRDIFKEQKLKDPNIW
jgi:hypothetical protein